MIPEIQVFAQWMDTELKSNSKKGDWRTFTDQYGIIGELEWHKAKLLMSIRDGNKDKMREYLADCANNLVFMANSLKLFDTTTPEEDLTGSN